MTPEVERRIKEDLVYQAKRKGVPAGFPPLPEIPAARYTDRAFFDLEMERIWRKTWLCVFREEEIPDSGSYTMFRKLGAPILIVRGKDMVVRAFYNTCRHRGAKVIKDECGVTNILRCQYHSWAYDLTGKLVNVPDEEDFVELDKSANALVPVKCEIWGGWIFINLDAEAEPLANTFSPLFAEWEAVKMQNLRVVHRYKKVIDCNWKAVADAFQEVYHIRTIHKDSIGTALNYKAASIGLMPHGHSRMITGYHDWAKKILGIDAPDTPNIVTMNDLHRNSSSSYYAFPNMVTPFRLSVIHFQFFWPISHQQTELEVVGIGPDWGDAEKPIFWDDSNARFRVILEEDMDNLFSIQKSMESGAISGVRLNYQERRIYWAHEEIDRRIGRNRIPEGLAVKPILGPYAEKPEYAAAE